LIAASGAIKRLRPTRYAPSMRDHVALQKKEPVPHPMQMESGLHPNIDTAKCRTVACNGFRVPPVD
jgi:hypothetical protein